jgi:hypothetical protein
VPSELISGTSALPLGLSLKQNKRTLCTLKGKMSF